MKTDPARHLLQPSGGTKVLGKKQHQTHPSSSLSLMENHSPFRMERLAWQKKTEGEETRTFGASKSWDLKTMAPTFLFPQLGMVVKGKLPERLPPPIGHLVLGCIKPNWEFLKTNVCCFIDSFTVSYLVFSLHSICFNFRFYGHFTEFYSSMAATS